jgi:hypothetical protein
MRTCVYCRTSTNGNEPEDHPVLKRWAQAEEALLKAGALQSAIFSRANVSSIATDAKRVTPLQPENV